MNLDKALSYASEKHEGQYRRQGNKYIDHPIRVMEILHEKGFKSDEYKLAALFHDLLEDTDASEEEILNLSNEKVLTLVKKLTKEKNYNNETYVYKISKDPMAKNIKLADRISNLEDTLHIYDLPFIKRYVKETEDFYEQLAKDTVFEKRLNELVSKLNSYIEELENNNS